MDMASVICNAWLKSFQSGEWSLFTYHWSVGIWASNTFSHA